MVSDKYFYRIEGLDYEEAIARLGRAVTPRGLFLLEKTESEVRYDCNWVSGPYVTIRKRKNYISVELDGDEEGFIQAENLLEEHLKTQLIGDVNQDRDMNWEQSRLFDEVR